MESRMSWKSWSLVIFACRALDRVVERVQGLILQHHDKTLLCSDSVSTKDHQADRPPFAICLDAIRKLGVVTPRR